MTRIAPACVLVVACVGPKAGLDSGEGSGEGSGDATSSSTSGGPDCDALANDDGFTPVSFVLENTRTEPIYLVGPNACQPEYLHITSLVEGMPGEWIGPHCALTCEDAMEGVCGCTADCPLVQTIRIEPGGRYTVEWNGMVLAPAPLPAECVAGDCAGDTCSIARRAVAGGPYQLVLGLVDVPLCIDDPACACTPSQDGWCALESYGDVATELPSFELVLADGVVVAIE
jgi:hypothetical protein